MSDLDDERDLHAELAIIQPGEASLADAEPPDLLARLIELRGTVQCMRMARDEAKAQFKEFHTAYLAASAPAQAQLAACERDTATAETALREAAEAYYATSLDKRPIAGVGIREVTEYNYDPETALDWAVQHQMRGLLQLNKSRFEGLARAAADDMPFVAITSHPQATLAADLGAAIAAEEQLP